MFNNFQNQSIKIETDKRINIYNIWSGKQLILCKGQRRLTQFNGKNWVLFWPSKSNESQMSTSYKNDVDTEFCPSSEG
ncbi:MAG: hypothetical protein PHN56_06015, partial [Candidatus Nanoarchaeia archaeon]|nr:hypothetical protein [Candidatus Nanoarchaeia archaeon]